MAWRAKPVRLDHAFKGGLEPKRLCTVFMEYDWSIV